ELLTPLVLLVFGHQPVARVGGRPRVRPERGDPHVVTHRPHMRVLPVGDVLQFVDRRNLIAHNNSFPHPTRAQTARIAVKRISRRPRGTVIVAVSEPTRIRPAPIRTSRIFSPRGMRSRRRTDLADRGAATTTLISRPCRAIEYERRPKLVGVFVT